MFRYKMHTIKVHEHLTAYGDVRVPIMIPGPFFL